MKGVLLLLCVTVAALSLAVAAMALRGKDADGGARPGNARARTNDSIYRRPAHSIYRASAMCPGGGDTFGRVSSPC